VAVDSRIMTFPEGYDGSTPVPLVFGFHGANRTNLEQQTVVSRTIGSELEQNYVMAFVKSAGTAWDLGTDHPRFQAIRSQFCIDTDHVFAFGHSSGSQFIAQMLGDNRGAKPALPRSRRSRHRIMGARAWSPVPPVPTPLIQGERHQNVRATATARKLRRSPCRPAYHLRATPRSTPSAGSTKRARRPPTLFCNHDDPNYHEDGNATNHGWPCFANSEIVQLFELRC
jgi:polyhydroxybutyrate depolymerase